MAYAEAKPLDSGAVPLIDIAPLRDGTGALAVARQLHAASQGLGFIYVTGHGIPDRAIEDARSRAFDFFRSDPAAKETVRVSARHRGWIARGGAKMQDGAKPDLKESFVWGWQDDAGRTPEDHDLRGPNRWPAFLPALEPAAMSYFDAAQAVACDLMRGFALGLGLAPEFFLRTSDRPLSRASFVYYPAQPPDLGPDQFGVGPHTDFGVLTVLCQDEVGGLQVRDVNGDWVQAPPIPGSLVVNVADLLARWTAGAYKSTPHRVVNSSGRERLSLVLAWDPNPETIIDARDVFGRDVAGAGTPITCGDYLIERFGRAFGYRTR